MPQHMSMATIRSQRRKHVTIFIASSAILPLVLVPSIFGLTSGLVQTTTRTCINRLPIISNRNQRRCLVCSLASSSSSSVADAVGETSELSEDDKQPIAYNWDEQFEELQKFMSEYGHCNFPQNPSVDLKEKYPLLERFCQDQWREYRLLQYIQQSERMTLAVFDRKVRCRQLEELGFEFNSRLAQWYDSYHELLEYFRGNGHTRVTRSENEPLAEWIYTQRKRRKGEKRYAELSDLQIKLLNDIGFEWDSQLAQWYDYYNKLRQYSIENGHTRVKKNEDWSLTQWVRTQRSRQRGPKSYGAKGSKCLSESQIKQLDDIGFEWESELYDVSWNKKYQELAAFRNEHGHFLMLKSSDPLYKWMTHQRRRRAGMKGYKTLTDGQIRLLDEIEFPWEPNRLDSKWFAMYDELKRFHKEYGHSQPGGSFVDTKLYEWVRLQPIKKRKGLLSAEQIKLLDELDYSWKPKIQEWATKLRELTEYFNKHGHIQVRQEDDPDLYDWMDTVRQRYHRKEGMPLTDAQIETFEDLHFCWALDWRDRVWHEKYTEAVEFFKEHAHISVAETENPSLYNWIQMQEKRYKGAEGQKPLSEEELEMLEQIDFSFVEGQPRMSWNAMYAKVVKYREDNYGRLPTKHKDDPNLSRWMRHQRHRYRSLYGYAPLSEEQKELLKSIYIPMYPQGKHARFWYEMYDELFKFRKENGHFFVDKSEKPSLYLWSDQQRVRYQGKGITVTKLSKMQLYLLERIGFTWISDRYEILWQQNYSELVEFLETQGHFPTISENPKLARWMVQQRQRYKGTLRDSHREMSESEIAQLEKIGFSMVAN